MRIDKFLKISLIFKTRSSAEKAIENNLILLNGKSVKPSTDVKPCDIILITFPEKKITYKILQILDKNVSRQMAKEMYEIVNEEINDF